jgi:hypothetical protein
MERDPSTPSLHPDLTEKSKRKENIKDILAELPSIDTVVYDPLETEPFSPEAHMLPDTDIHRVLIIYLRRLLQNDICEYEYICCWKGCWVNKSPWLILA